MVALHQRSRRTVCRVAFLALCALPTVLVLVWIFWLHTPAHVRIAAQAIASELGVDVSIDRVSHPRPGATVYQGVVLADGETGARILVSDEVRTARRGGTLLVTAARVELHAAHLDLLWQALADRLRVWQTGSAQLAVGQVVAGAATVARLRGRLDATRDGTQSLISFALPDAAEESSVQVRLHRNRQTVPPTTQVELRTGKTAVPCAAAWPLLPGLAELGDSAHFRGVAWVNLQGGSWAGQILGGELTAVDFEKLVSSRYPSRLGGTARISIAQAHLHNGRLVAASGSLSVGPGLIGHALCLSALECLQLRAADLLVQSSQLIPYQQLACAFAVDQNGLQLRGACRDAPPGTLLTASTGPLLAVTHTQPIPLAALVRTLVPRRDLLVPATPAAEALVRSLPQTALDRSHTAAQRDPQQR